MRSSVQGIVLPLLFKEGVGGAELEELSLVLPPLPGLEPRWGLVSQGWRPGLSFTARPPTGSGPASGGRPGATIKERVYISRYA